MRRIWVSLAQLATLGAVIAVVSACSLFSGKSPASSTANTAQLPQAILSIVPVAANQADANVITANLPGTTTTVQMGATGLNNVSVGVPVTIKGMAANVKDPAKSYAWTLTKPNASKTSLSASDQEATKFTPDVPGIYKIDLIVGNDAGKSQMSSVKVYAGEYIGIEKGGCNTCHAEKAAEWSETGHATQFTREIDGGADPANSHYGEACIRCHSVGYYIGASNGGFADLQAKLGWSFPSAASIQSGTGNWDAVPDELKNVANIQCENCHGPAKDHVEKKTPMAVSLDEGVCNTCHNGGGHHVKGYMFENSAHSEKGAQAWSYPTGPARQDCVRCHSGTGYISFIQNPTEKAAWNNDPQTVTCAVCHDPHSDANKFQLRVVGKPIEANGVTKDFGLSATCTECHNGRTKPADAQKGSFPHYSAAAEMLSDTGGVEYGQKIVNSLHATVVGSAAIADPADKTGEAKLFGGAVPGSCVACHMWPTPADAKDPNRFKVGDHSFNVTSPDGKSQYTEACKSCHGDLASFNLTAKADYDGNGKTEGVQDEVAGLLKKLQKAIGDSGVKPVEGHPYFDRDDVAKAGENQKNAIYNYLFVRGLEGSDGKAAAIHNFKRSVALLQIAYRDLTGKDIEKATLIQ